jgi:hypothetical protein
MWTSGWVMNVQMRVYQWDIYSEHS